MPTMIDTVRSVMSAPRGSGEACLVCGRRVAEGDPRVRLRGGTVVHRDCATYERRGSRR